MRGGGAVSGQTGISLDVNGVKETYAKLREISLMPSQKREILDGVRRGGEIIAELARRGVRVRSGDLKESICTVDAHATHTELSVRIIASRPKGSHGWLVENGHIIRGGKGRARAIARPFLAPALSDGRDAALREIAGGIEAAIERSVK